ncbi:MAG: hypothetical protein IKH26_03200 [Bacteroidaceae bacterium]|nr:hypothetical protein [Bacteroidaceae bacterium]
MKRLLYFVVTLFVLTSTLSAQETTSTPDLSGQKKTLLEVLKAIEQSQSEYSINIVSDGLDGLTVEAQTNGLDAASAVRRLCEGLPVKVKVHGKRIYVQLERRKAMRKQTPQTEREIEISGKVEDGFLKMPLIHAKVSICRADSSVLVDSAAMTSIYTGNMRLTYALYHSKVTTDSKTLLIHATLKGYEGVWKSVNVGKQTEIDVPTLEMRKVREVELGEVLVKATRVKMFYRGDTIVYDATAFKLPEGSMLDDLIRQMPGVTMNEAGEIFVNGRKVDELLLGSRSFMRGNKRVLMENLPYYTVKDIKVYEKQSDKSVALGYDVDPKKYVMDVNLKQEYQRGYIANAEGAIGTMDWWMARAFALGFTDRLRFTLLGNLNNVNESRHIGESGNWTPATMPKNKLTTRSVAGEIDYHSKEEKVKNNLTASYTSTTDVSESRSRYEQFQQGLTPTSLTKSFSRASNRQWNAHDEFTLTKPFYLYAVADFSYSKNHGAFSSMFDQWNDTLTASQRNRGFNEGKAWSGSMEAQGAFNVGKNQKHVDFYVRAQHSENESESAMRYTTRQYVNPQQTIQHNVNDISNRTTWGVASLNYGMQIFKGVDMGVGESLYLTRIDARDYLYHPDSLLLASQIDALTAITDINNSYDSRTKVAENTVGISFSGKGKYKMAPNSPFTISYQRWNVGISIPIRHESLDYQRGRLDTLARQNTLFVNTSASFRHASEDGKQDFRVHASHKRSAANLSDRITYRDDSQPLVVKLGNPDLKSFVTSNFGIDYSNKAGRNQQQWHVGTSADLYHRQTAQSASYDPASGVYTYQPMNVKGAYRLNAKLDISRAIDKNRYWTWQTNADAGYHHSIDHAMLSGMTASEENVVNTLTLHDGAYIQYNKGALNIRATGDIRWRHSEGKMYDFETLNATDFQYGLSARYTLPRINTTLSADGNMYSRRGYGSSELNTDDFVLNASVSQPFFKGKLIARIEALDLLHQLSNTQYSVNAQGRTETWYRSLPHYVMLHLVYHWSRQNSKRKANLD